MPKTARRAASIWTSRAGNRNIPTPMTNNLEEDAIMSSNTKRAKDEVMEAGAEAVEKAKEAVQAVGAMAGHAVSAVGETADDLTAAAGHKVKQAGDTIEKKSPHDG